MRSFLFFAWRYNSSLVSARSAVLSHASLSTAILHKFWILIFPRSAVTSPSCLTLGLPILITAIEPNIVRVIKSRRKRWAGRGVHKVLVGEPDEKRPLGRPRRRWEDNIKMDLQEVGRGCDDCMELAQDRDRWRALVSTVMNFRVVP